MEAFILPRVKQIQIVFLWFGTVSFQELQFSLLVLKPHFHLQVTLSKDLFVMVHHLQQKNNFNIKNFLFAVVTNKSYYLTLHLILDLCTFVNNYMK